MTEQARRLFNSDFQTHTYAKLIHVWFGHLKCVLYHPHIFRATGFFGKNDFDDVEAKLDFRVAQQPQVIESNLAEVALFCRVHRLAWRAKVLVHTRFDLDEHQPFAVTADDVNLPCPAAKAANKDLVAAPTQMAGGPFLAAPA